MDRAGALRLDDQLRVGFPAGILELQVGCGVGRNATSVRSKTFLLILILVAFSLPGVSWAEPPPKTIPVIYCSDLFHPHDDPDDHFDIATIYAILEFGIKAIILDQGRKQDKKPGRIPVEQLNHLTGRDIPWANGLADPLKTPDDTAADQDPEYQKGVMLILDTLKGSKEPVTIITVGSVRDVAAALNREPHLFRRKVAKLVMFIGDAQSAFQEYNVKLDPYAYIRVMNSGLPIWWVPCFDGGPRQNEGNASFWQANHADLLRNVSCPVLNYFIYALEKGTSDHIAYLGHQVNEETRKRVLSGKRNLWCCAVFTEIADRSIVRRDGEWLAVPAGTVKHNTNVVEVFTYAPVSLSVDGQANVVYGEEPRSHKVNRFQVVNNQLYPTVMTSVTNRLLRDLGEAEGP